MATWQNIQRYLRQAGVDTCFLSLAADPDFDPSAEFPFNRVVFVGYTCAGKYVRIDAQNPVVNQVMRRTRRVLESRGFGFDVRDTYEDGVDIVLTAATVTTEPLLDFKAATIEKCKPSDRDEDRPAKDQVWCLFTKDGDRLLGRHPTKEKAERQERAIQVRKHS